VQASDRLGQTVAEHYRLAMAFSRDSGFDAASAYAVLLGVLSPAKADELRRSAEQCAPTEKADPVSPGAQREYLQLEFDPAFAPAIESRHLTVEQAVARGEREVYAMGLVRRHRISKERACLVADNKMTIRSAIREAEQARVREAEATKRQSPARSGSGSGLWRLGAVAFLVLGVTAVGWFTWKQRIQPSRGTAREVFVPAQRRETPSIDSKPAAPPVERIGSDATEIRTDAHGRVIEVVGPDPMSVLVAFCELSEELTPLEITSTMPAVRDARLGLFLDQTAAGGPSAIRIRKNAQTRRWAAESGGGPVHVVKAPELPPQAVRIPVENR
jgi:hypothetical protein